VNGAGHSGQSGASPDERDSVRCDAWLGDANKSSAPDAEGAGSGGVGGVLFPGFKVPPNDPSREVKPRAGLTVSEPPRDMSDDYDDDGEEEACVFCEGWGYVDCLCGGDFCVCDYNGEIPCYHCG